MNLQYIHLGSYQVSIQILDSLEKINNNSNVNCFLLDLLKFNFYHILLNYCSYLKNMFYDFKMNHKHYVLMNLKNILHILQSYIYVLKTINNMYFFK